MAITINRDSSSFTVSQPGRSPKNLAPAREKVLSEQRINTASGNAAGIPLADSLHSQARGMGQALRNVNEAISMAQVADSALGQAQALVQAIREKAMQAADAGQTAETRQGFQSDLNKSLALLDAIAQETTYNGQQLLSGAFTGKEVQTGTNSSDTIKLAIASAATDKLGSPSLGKLSEINVLSQENARTATKIADAALEQIDTFRAGIDATRQQLAATINTLATTGSNLLSAASTSADVDLAEETINVVTMKILTEANASAQAQTKNMNKQNILSLLQG